MFGLFQNLVQYNEEMPGATVRSACDAVVSSSSALQGVARAASLIQVLVAV